MLQRNDRHHSVDLPTLNPPATVHPGETIDHDELIAGFVPVEEPAEAPADVSEGPVLGQDGQVDEDRPSPRPRRKKEDES
jgi:hypothetical protein